MNFKTVFFSAVIAMAVFLVMSIYTSAQVSANIPLAEVSFQGLSQDQVNETVSQIQETPKSTDISAASQIQALVPFYLSQQEADAYVSTISEIAKQGEDIQIPGYVFVSQFVSGNKIFGKYQLKDDSSISYNFFLACVPSFDSQYRNYFCKDSLMQQRSLSLTYDENNDCAPIYAENFKSVPDSTGVCKVCPEPIFSSEWTAGPVLANGQQLIVRDVTIFKGTACDAVPSKEYKIDFSQQPVAASTATQNTAYSVIVAGFAFFLSLAFLGKVL